jgi:single-strand DNA-binding protein
MATPTEHTVRAHDGGTVTLRRTYGRGLAIRLFCTECLGWDTHPKHCTGTTCPLYPYRDLMAYGIASIHLVGNLGHAPSLKEVNGAKVAEFSLAVNRGRKGEEKTDWYRLTLWRGLAEIAEKYLAKGSPIYAEGELALREYQGRDGTTKFAADVNVSRLAMLGSKPDGEPGQDRTRDPQEAPGSTNGTHSSEQPASGADGDPGPSRAPGEDDDDLPF